MLYFAQCSVDNHAHGYATRGGSYKILFPSRIFLFFRAYWKICFSSFPPLFPPPLSWIKISKSRKTNLSRLNVLCNAFYYSLRALTIFTSARYFTAISAHPYVHYDLHITYPSSPAVIPIKTLYRGEKGKISFEKSSTTWIRYTWIVRHLLESSGQSV